MKILVKDEIRNAIRRCMPSKIAVAFIGADWETYIPDAQRLDAIIISPTLGSNPKAIIDLSKKVGWGKVHFLDELHAKTYIGSDAAVIGSANLTCNGLSGNGLIELCTKVESKEELRTLNENFEDLKEIAKQKYPTIKEKKARLQKLKEDWKKAITQGLIKKHNNDETNFFNFEFDKMDPFYVIDYQVGTDYKHSKEVNSIKSWISDEIHFAKNDEVKKHSWVLVWNITEANKPHKRTKPYWLYIHEVFKDGVIDDNYDYPQVAIQRNDLDVPPFPFQINRAVGAAFKRAIMEPQIAKYLIQESEDVFGLSHSLKGVPLLIKKMKEYMRDTQKSPETQTKRRG